MMDEGKSRRRAVVSLDVESRISALTELDISKPYAAVVGGGMFVHSQNGTKERQWDAVRSLLLAQLVADRQHDKFGDPANWDRVFQNTLTMIGWRVEGSSMSIRYRPPATDFSIRTAVRDLFRTRAGQPGDESALVSAIDALRRENQDSPARRVFRSSSVSGETGKFQAGIIVEQDSDLSVTIGIFWFSSSDRLDDPVSAQFPKATSLYSGSLSLRLNLRTFSAVRAEIEKKLGVLIDELVQPILMMVPREEEDRFLLCET